MVHCASASWKHRKILENKRRLELYFLVLPGCFTSTCWMLQKTCLDIAASKMVPGLPGCHDGVVNLIYPRFLACQGVTMA